MIRAFAFLIFTTAANRLRSQLRRLRTPRYAIGLALGLGYFWMLFGRRAFTTQARAASDASAFYLTLAPLFVMVTMSGIWLFGGDRSALAFSEAEVAMLLTAPVSRRGLIVYKLAKGQFVMVLNALIWVLVLRRGSSSLPAMLAAAAVWVTFTTLSLHRMGAALVRAKQMEYRTASRRGQWAKVAFGVMIGLMAWALIMTPIIADSSRPGASSDPFAFLRVVVAALSSPRARLVLSPFRLLVAPIFAADAPAWATAILPALGILLVHVAWVLRSDAAFEEAAAMASAERAKVLEHVRSRRTAAPPPAAGKAARTIALSPHGRPAAAIVWKNVLAFSRTFRAGSLMRLVVLAVVVPALITWKSGDPARTLFAISAAMVVLVPLVLVQTLRTDLRSDMQHLPFLKSLPLPARDLVLAEIAPGALAVAAVQWVFFVAAVAATAWMPGKIDVSPALRAGFVIASPVVFLSLSVALLTILNGAAVLFPAWQRLGPAAPGGVEVMGQAILSMVAATFVFLLLLLIPALAGGAAWFALHDVPAIAVPGGALAAAAVLLAESYGVSLRIARAFERAEPQQVA